MNVYAAKASATPEIKILISYFIICCSDDMLFLDTQGAFIYVDSAVHNKQLQHTTSITTSITGWEDMGKEDSIPGALVGAAIELGWWPHSI